jgi:hypothetical protein
MRLATRAIFGVVVAVVLPVLAAASNDSAVVARPNDARDLQGTTLGDVCSLLLSAAVGATIPQLADSVKCECDPTLVPSLSVALSCASTEPVCLSNIVCGTPSIEAGLDITALLGGESPLTFEVCYTQAILGGTIELPTDILCLSFLQTLLGSIGIGGGGGGGGGAAATTPVGGAAPGGGGAAAPAGKKGATPVVQGDSVRTCTATLGGQECSSCSFCDGGMIFDCSNIDGKVATSECIPMKVPNDINDVYHPDAMIAA